MIFEKGFYQNLMMKDKTYDFDTIFKTKNSRLINISLSGSALRNKQNKIKSIVFIGRNITERKMMEEIKDRFVSAVTHELRTPLVSIKGYLDLILSEKIGSIPEKIKSNLEVIKRNSDVLLRLTTDLLDIRQLESGKLRLNTELLDFREIISNCIKEVEPFLTKKNQKLKLQIPLERLPMYGDKIRIKQVILNLLDNAIKFTPEKGHIEVILTHEKAIYQIQITDTGIGIKNEDLQRIFEPFSAIKKPTYIKGTGLGLSIVKGLVKLHGGRIWAKSLGEGGGATFTVVLPKDKKRGGEDDVR
jgi:signal transduction histidine kinase